MLWWEHAIETWVEIVSGCLLLNLFSKQYSQKRIYLLLCPFLITLTDMVLSLSLPQYSTVVWFMDYVLFSVGVFLFVRRSFKEALLESLIAIAFVEIIEFFLIAVFEIMNLTEALYFTGWLIQLLLLLVAAFAAATSKIIKKRFRSFYYTYRRVMVLILFNISIMAFIELYLWKQDGDFFRHELGVIAVVLLLWIALNLFLLKALVDNRRKEEMLFIQKQYGSMMDKQTDYLYEERHEFKKHLHTVLGFTQIMTPELAVAAIEEYIGDLTDANERGKDKFSLYQTGNSTINAFLYVKCKEAREKGIQLSYFPSGEFPEYPCKPYELNEIIGNLLDNVFEYVTTLDADKREVELTLETTEEGFSLIRTRNPFYPEYSLLIAEMTHKHVSSKDGRGRGYGLVRVQKIAEKYKGALEIYQENDFLVVEVLFKRSSRQGLPWRKCHKVRHI